MNTPSHEEIVNKYGLEVLKNGADLQVSKTGDLELTSDGDLKLGDDCHNALFRLVRRWCFNAPTLSALFDSVIHTRRLEKDFNERRNQIASRVFDDPFAIQEFHRLGDEIGASEYGCAAYAGTIMVVLNNLLQRFKKDIDPASSMSDWKNSGPLINGYSIFSIIEAASNNFRHYDEWARDLNSPKNQQLASIRVIAACLDVKISPDGKHHPFRRNMCPEILEAISEGVYENLNSKIFLFANSIAIRKRSS